MKKHNTSFPGPNRIKISNLILAIFCLVGCTRPSRQGDKTTTSVPLSDPASDSISTLNFTILDRNAKDIDWLHSTNLIAYPRMDPVDGYYDIWTIRPDGSNKTCLTCGENFPKKHNGNVTWHPSGKYLVFTGQNVDASGELMDALAIPGTGLNCNLWAMSADGEQIWQITNIPTEKETPQGLIHPQFSHDGTQLLWAQALGKYSAVAGEEWGKWQLAIADFILEDGNPVLQNIQYSQPGSHPRFYESHGWSPDDSLIIFSANPEDEQHPPNGIDIYTMDVISTNLTRLTHTPSDWDEHAHINPDGSMIAWMSGAELDVEFHSTKWPDWKEYIATELWLMDLDGGNQHRLTYFNQPGHPHLEWLQEKVGVSIIRTVVSDSAWSPDGTQLIFTLAYEAENEKDGMGTLLIMMDVEK
ncbi:MAG: PD40 domain-containing protein [Anaerolineaceae bacterium]|nr:PD40 domain-containing protein [Anaerolineaceae bacterium]